MLFPGTGFPHDIGGPDARGQRGQRRAPARHRRRRLAARLPRRGAAAGARVRARRAGDPARLRLPRRRPARPPDAERRRPAGGVPRAPRPRPRGRRRPLGGHRRRRLRAGGGGAAGLDAPARDRRRGARSTRPPRPRTAWRELRPRGARPHRAAPPDRRSRPGVPRLVARATTRTTWLDRAIHATRTEVFPLHGLDPLP